MNLYPYQLKAANWLSRRKRGMVVAPAGSGKTVIAAGALDLVLRAKERTQPVNIGWLANTREQVDQAARALNSFGSIRSELVVKHVYCAAACRDWSDCDVLIVDESHHSMAPEWKAQIETCKGALWGFTATPDYEGFDAQERDAGLKKMFVEILRISREEVESRISKAKVVWLDPVWIPGLAKQIDAETEKTYRWRSQRWGGDLFQLRAMVWWQKCIELGIVGNRQRTQEAVIRARTHIERGDVVLVLVNQVEHAKEVAELIGDSAKACYSGMGAKARRHTLYDFKTGKLPCIVATSLADEGLDVPRANVLVLVSGGKNRARTEQRTGRVLRQFAGKEHGIIYDFLDSEHKLMRKHALKRRALYEDLGYEQ